MSLYYGLITKNNIKKDVTSLIEYANTQNIEYQDIITNKLQELENLTNLPQKSTIVIANVLTLGQNYKSILENIKKISHQSIKLILIKENIIITPNISFLETLDIAYKLYHSINSIKNKAIQEGLKNKGLTRGRPTGSRQNSHILTSKKEIIINRLTLNIPKAQIAKELGVGRTTLYLFIKEHQLTRGINGKS